MIVYLSRENLSIAKAAFKAAAGNQTAVGARLIKAAESVLTADLVEKKVIDSLDTGSVGTIAAAMRAKPAKSPALKLLYELCSCWMQHMSDKNGLPMPTRNTQSLTMLMVGAWLDELIAVYRDKAHTLVARVGTGEGKSLIIFMLAVHAVKKGKRVHVLASNKVLRDRDFEEFSLPPVRAAPAAPGCAPLPSTVALFSQFGMTVSNTLNTKADVTYIVRSELEEFYRDHKRSEACLGNYDGPLKNVVLLADEVDSLIVDGSPSSCFSCEDVDDTPHVVSAFLAIDAASAPSAAVRPGLCGAKLWADCVDAVTQARAALVCGQNCSGGFIIDSGTYRLLDVAGAVVYYWSLAVQYLNWKDPRFQIPPCNSTVFYVQSLPHIIRGYFAIVGVSGSLGSPEDRAYLSREYGADCIESPTYMKTLENPPLVSNTLVDDCVFVYPSEADQVAAIVERAVASSETVPVLVICECV